MELNTIKYKKPFYPIQRNLREHLRYFGRTESLPVQYEDLQYYQELIPIYDKDDNDTFWYHALYSNAETEQLKAGLVRIYELLVADGRTIPHLKIASIDFCSFGNSKPFRIKVINEINDNHDYYYIKRADASRIYGLELEEIFSPDDVYFLVDNDTLIEAHIVGIPCDEFILQHNNVKIENRTRFAKQFVKFNERCFVRLLGDMRAYNFVVEITLDFDNVQYQFRAMDFDQQNYEGRKNIYLPQFYKDNLALVALCQELLSNEVAEQYQLEERAAMKKRYLNAKKRCLSILKCMKSDTVSTKEHIESLRGDFAKYHKEPKFHNCTKMGEVLELHLVCRLGIKV